LERILAVTDDDEAVMIAWQDVLDQVVAGRPNDLVCPYCKHRPLVVEEVEYSTKISCPRCGKFIQGKFA
jgi:DNA-directed RNA polymerase subunit RPC12/RpoP